MLRRVLPLLLLIALLLPGVGQAQDGPVPVDTDAELYFDQALDAFKARDYGMAYRRFRLVYETTPLNRKTTASVLMAGKALYRDGRYQEAADLLSSFVARYPTSSYLTEARRTRDFALQQLGELERQAETRQLGILLPLGDQDAALTQSLFNGIRLAVEEHNSIPGNPTVRMVFRDTRADRARAAEAVATLAVNERVDALIGPLYSEEARAAADAAERAGVTLVAPLATDEDVSENRRFVFQANPTIMMRGRLMARFAMRSMLLDDFAIVAEQGNSSNAGISERMAEGFQQEVHLQGGTVHRFRLLPNARAWSSLPQHLAADSLRAVRALYLPVAGQQAGRHIGAALSGLDALGLATRTPPVRVLGNAEWHDQPYVLQAAAYGATYTNDFYVDPDRADVQAFVRAYRGIAGKDPDRLGHTGYDVTRLLLQEMTRTGGASLPEKLRAAPLFQGTGIRIDFVDGNVNEALYYLRYRDTGFELVR